jgi:phage virion morphogenesis protein
MAGASVTIDDRDLLAALSRLQQAGGNMRAVFNDIGELLLKSTSERFESEQSPDGEPWALLTVKYVTEKPYNYDKILVLDGYLLGSLDYQSSETAVQIGTNIKYGATHQFGRPDDGIIARPFLGLSASDKEEVLIRIAEHLRHAV